MEDRTVPAGNVQAYVFDRVLYVDGDDAGNQVLITGMGQNGAVISSLDGTTTINGQSAVFVGGIKKGYHIAMRGGDDALIVTGAQSRGGLNVDMGEGNDGLGVSNAEYRGGVTLRTGGGDDIIDLRFSVFRDSLVVDTGAGDDQVTTDLLLGSALYAVNSLGLDYFDTGLTRFGRMEMAGFFLGAKPFTVSPPAVSPPVSPPASPPPASPPPPTGQNNPPIAAAISATVGEDGPAVPLTASFTDPDGADTFTFSVDTTGTLGSVVNNGDGTFTYDPNGAFESLAAGQTATDTFSYTVTDNSGASSTATATVTVTGVNDPASISGTATGSVTEDDPAANTAGGTLSVSDPDSGENVFQIPASLAGTYGSFTFDIITGAWAYTLDNSRSATQALAAGQQVTDTLTVTSQDGTASQAIVVTITGANDPPVAVDDTNNTDKDTPASGNVLTNDTDADAGDTLTVSTVNGDPANVGVQIALTSGALVTVNADGTYTYDPNGAFDSLAHGATASDSFTYTATDSQGASSNTATVTITVTGANQAPVAMDDTNSTDEDTPVSGNVLTNDTDADSDTLTVTAVNDSAANVGVQLALSSGALVTVNADGTYTYDPNGAFDSLATGQTATDSFSYTISDGFGGTDAATVTITITGVNDPPVANDNTATTDEDTPLDIDVLANDTDPDTSDVLTVTAVDPTSTLGAAVSINPDGTIRYDPTNSTALSALATGETATDTFSYTISDGNGGTVTVAVSVTVTGANDPPTTADDTNSTDKDAPVSGNVLTNDTDPDTSDALTVTAVNGDSANVGVQLALASGALVTVNADGTYTYDPNGAFPFLVAGETATDSFNYAIGDGNGGTGTATVTITVTG